jgi:CheY-like chemotaxis protein/Tfp pilus assembly protein PilZ
MKNVLIVDSDPFMLDTLVGLLKSQSGFLNVVSAENGKAALDILACQPIHVVITGLRLPKIDGFELVVLLAKLHPDVRVIVMTSNASPMLRAKIKQIPTAVHFDRALDISLLTQRIFTELGISYGGQVRGVNLSSFLQMIELEGRTCMLQVRGKGRVAFLWIRKGELIAAEVGDLRGESAALMILGWEHVVIDIDYSHAEKDVEITTPLMGLMMESSRLMDEQKCLQTNQRKHDRYNLLVAVDYDISDLTYQCFLRDISLGGAYIETEQMIQIGDRISLSLSAPEIDRPTVIDCQVVRRDDKGIGVCFESLTLQQKKVIETLERRWHKAEQDLEPPEMEPL